MCVWIYSELFRCCTSKSHSLLSLYNDNKDLFNCENSIDLFKICVWATLPYNRPNTEIHLFMATSKWNDELYWLAIWLSVMLVSVSSWRSAQQWVAYSLSWTSVGGDAQRESKHQRISAISPSVQMLGSDPAPLDFQSKGYASSKRAKLWNSGAFIADFKIKLWT